MVTYKFNGAWVAEQPLTKEQKEAVKNNIANRGKKDKDGKTVKPAKIQREFSPADKTVEKQLVAIFEKHKPKEEYSLIDTSITIENGKARGIINCRINGEHRQIRIAE